MPGGSDAGLEPARAADRSVRDWRRPVLGGVRTEQHAGVRVAAINASGNAAGPGAPAVGPGRAAIAAGWMALPRAPVAEIDEAAG